MRHFDLVIVGTGSANSILDERFTGWKVALIERGPFGGTCLNVGCIPTKMFVHTADIAADVADAGRFGVDAAINQVRWADIRDRIFGRIDPIAADGAEYRMSHPDNDHVTVYRGEAAFTGHKRLTITMAGGSTETITADQIVVAAGGRPDIPDVDGLADVGYYTSDTVMRLAELPKRITILGSGFVAAEFAHLFGSLGVQVTVIARSAVMLSAEDGDVSARFTELAARRWTLHRNSKTRSAERIGDAVRLHLDAPNGPETVDGEVLLVATGRRPNTDHLDAAAGGLATDESGRLVVDEHQRTSVDGIWALGDISSPHTLKHVANHEQRVVQHNLLHPGDLVATDHRYVPHAVFTAPQIAAVGLTEEQARARGIRYVTSTHDYAGIAYGWALEDTTGFAKLLADPATGQILGAHIIGPHAATVIQPLIQAMSFGLDAANMARGQYWIHPALPELVENALLKLPLDPPR